VSSNAFREIEQLEKNRAIKIITGGLGSFKKPKVSFSWQNLNISDKNLKVSEHF
jgi:hypothetical protein